MLYRLVQERHGIRLVDAGASQHPPLQRKDAHLLCYFALLRGPGAGTGARTVCGRLSLIAHAVSSMAVLVWVNTGRLAKLAGCLLHLAAAGFGGTLKTARDDEAALARDTAGGPANDPCTGARQRLCCCGGLACRSLFACATSSASCTRTRRAKLNSFFSFFWGLCSPILCTAKFLNKD